MNPKLFRQVMSQWPTGVCVVTGASSNGHPLGMVIGSFCSVSLEPPLVAFFVKTGSATWREIHQQGGHFCVNVLSYKQAGLCTTFSTGEPNRRFDGVAHQISTAGVPHLSDCCAWIDASCDKLIELGDHLMVVGRVHGMHQGPESIPLVFAKGRLSRTEPLPNLREDHFLLWEDSLQAASPVWLM